MLGSPINRQAFQLLVRHVVKRLNEPFPDRLWPLMKRESRLVFVTTLCLPIDMMGVDMFL